MEINWDNIFRKLIFKTIGYFLLPAIFICISFDVSALESNSAGAPPEVLSKSTVEYYKKDIVTNEIPYFDNRFRLDAEIDEITLIFYRKSGSTPIILIRPDGSKIRVDTFDPDTVQWFDDSTFDLIKIKRPMPGPWQAVGDILPNSQILVVSDVKIEVKPLPEIVFSGETLKVVGRLFNGEAPITSSQFRRVINLDVHFFSTNNSLYDNFGADGEKVTSFRDDGKGLDEYANDNKFTGEFLLDLAPGEWQPVYLVKMPMTTRELRQPPIVLHKTPVEITIEKSSDSDKPHTAIFSINSEYVDPDSLIFQGKYTFPDRQLEPFSISEGKGDTRITEITNTEPGLYRINVSAFGKTINGREFRLVLPEFSFNVEPYEQFDPSPGSVTEKEEVYEATADDLLLQAEQDKMLLIAEQQAKQNEKRQQTIIIITAANAGILVIAVILFLIVRKKKAKQSA